MAVAEEKFQFEHRDLHWGNILLSRTDQTEAIFRLHGREITVPTFGIKACIIDYTLSRMFCDKEDRVLYNDLSQDDDLFTSEGDYQYQIYPLMKLKLANEWENFEPYTNILWLHYVVDKMIDGVHYKKTKNQAHRSAIHEMMQLRDEMLENKSAAAYAEVAY